MENHEHVLVIECPECHRKSEFLMLEALNSSIDVYEKQKLLNDELFEFKCKCGHQMSLLHEFVFYDADHDATVYFVPGDDVDGVCTALRLTDKLNAKNAANCEGEYENGRKRIVTCTNRLREKVSIFENGLDDRIIEMVKIIGMDHIGVNMPDFEVLGAFFDVKDGKRVIELVGEEKTVIAIIPDDLYEQLQHDYAEVLANDDEYIIDEEWAMNVMGMNSEMECDGDCEHCAHCDHDELDDECTGYYKECDRNCDNCECDKTCDCNDDDRDVECRGCERDCDDCDCKRCEEIFDDEDDDEDDSDEKK